jgi:hypothetical protein
MNKQILIVYFVIIISDVLARIHLFVSHDSIALLYLHVHTPS